MASSGTYGFTAPGDEILTEAWERLGLNPAILTAEHAASARRSMQLMMIGWGNLSARLWQIEPIALTLTAGTPTVALPARVMDVLDCYVTASGVDTILGQIGRSDYVAISNKSVQSKPTQLWAERVQPAVTLHLYPTPDIAYAMTAYCLRQPQDMSLLTQTMDAPLMWADAASAGLAARLARKYKPEIVADLTQEAAAAYAAASGESRERVPLNIMPGFMS